MPWRAKSRSSVTSTNAYSVQPKRTSWKQSKIINWLHGSFSLQTLFASTYMTEHQQQIKTILNVNARKSVRQQISYWPKKKRENKRCIRETRTWTWYQPTSRRWKNNQIFCYNGRISTKDGAIYVDFTGKFTIRSMDGMVTIFIVYDWTTNAILATPVKNMAEETIVSCFKQKITYLTKRGFKPILNIIDNVASKAVQAYLEAENVSIQLVEPHNHRLNAAERTIQTFQNHLISGLSTWDASFPLLLWNNIVPQSQDYLNILRTSRVHPKLSAYSVLKGIHDFNRHPWAPPGTRATIFNLPETRTSFGPRDIDAWYIGPAPQNYRCYNFFLPLTGGILTSGQATFYSQHCTVPKETQMDYTRHITASLVTAIQRL